MDYRLVDSKYTGFTPKTASEAIIKFRRLAATGISPFQYPEAFCECGKALGPDEAAKFEDWLVCPQGEPGADCTPVEVFAKENLKVHEQLVLEQENRSGRSPGSIPEEDDEKAD